MSAKILYLLFLLYVLALIGCQHTSLTARQTQWHEGGERFEPAEPTARDLFCLSNILARCNAQGSTNMLLLIRYLPWEYECVGAFYWLDETDSQWYAATFAVPTNSSCYPLFSDEGFEVVQKGKLEAKDACRVMSEAREAIFTAQYSNVPIGPIPDGGKDVITICRGDRYLFCSCLGSTSEFMRRLTRSIMSTAANPHEIVPINAKARGQTKGP